MCGIAGYVATNEAAAEADVVSDMIAELRHRGPDDAGVWADGRAALGAARLSIIDIAGGHQPISVAGGVTVVQNGEIYNYVELRRDLERRGRSFATASDTEVIAALYAEAGEAAFDAMRGMFAIAIWDATRQRLVLARDRVGKKPLYYLNAGDRFLFASETKAILAALARTPDVAAAPLVEFLTFGYVAGDESIFDGMRRLPPGCVLTLDRGQAPSVRRYWTWPRDADGGMPEDEYLERLGAELDDAAAAAGVTMRHASLSGFGSDATAILKSGIVPRAACLAFATENTHGFEIAHLDGIAGCVRVLEAWLG
jgi:asparagine synthase (glutamine-hydrolysing)